MNKAIWTMSVAAVLTMGGQRLLAQEKAAKPSPDVPVWTCDMVRDEFDKDTVKELKPITMTGARNGYFSGKVVIESTSVIRDAQASVTALTGENGGIIPISNIHLRYGVEYIRIPGLDSLLESPPAEVALNNNTRHALLSVWATVQVPKDAKAGKYTGELIVQGVHVPMNLTVSDWTLPDPQDYRTFLDFVESPDTLAIEYNVPLWSEQHWKLIARSFQLLSSSGGRTLYVPLISRTNLGNEQSMVRWIKKGENQYEYDYSILEQYVDTAVKNLGKPRIIVFQVWDICLVENLAKQGLPLHDVAATKRIVEARLDVTGKGPRVTAFDPATKEVSTIFLPRYEDPASKALWMPMFTEVRKRMEKRGLDKAMMLGLMNDAMPNKQETTFWQEVSGGLPWVSHGHAGARDDVIIGNKGLNKIADIGYAAYVYGLTYNVNPDKGRLYGWKNPGIMAAYVRGGMRNRCSALMMRELPAFDITGYERGEGRMGAEYWYVMKNSKGERCGTVCARYPENNWRNLDIYDNFLAPGPDSPVGTARLEYLKEGTQVCEARILLEDTLLDNSKKEKIGAELAKQCQEALDEHHRAMWKALCSSDESLSGLGKVAEGRDPQEGLDKGLQKIGKQKLNRPEEERKGRAWFVVGYQEREKKLFDLAGEVAAQLSSK